MVDDDPLRPGPTSRMGRTKGRRGTDLMAGLFLLQGRSIPKVFDFAQTPLSNARQIAGLIRQRRGMTSAGE
jgi:hypothetical protein